MPGVRTEAPERVGLLERARPFALLAGMALGLATSGCGHTVFAVHAAQATRDLEQARELGAEQLAPYEYFYAKEHLKKAKQEASEADYGDAAHLAADAKRYALRAIRKSKDARRGAQHE